MAHIVVKVGEKSVITRTNAEELALKKGDAVRVVIKINGSDGSEGLRLNGPIYSAGSRLCPRRNSK